MIKYYSFVVFLSVINVANPLLALDWFETTRAGIPGNRLNTGPTEKGWSLSTQRLEEEVVTSIYLNAKLHQKIIENYSDGYLISRDEFDSDNQLISHVEYAYDSDGKMRLTLFSNKIDGTEPEKIFTSLSNNIDWADSRAIEGNDNKWYIADKNKSGRNVREISLEDEEITREVNYLLDNEGRLAEKKVLAGNSEIRTEFNSNGLPVKETVSLNKLITSEKTYQWEDSRLVSVEEKTGANMKKIDKKWDNNQLVSEIEWLNGRKEKETVWSAKDSWVETVYRNNKPVLRIEWQNNVKVKEEIINLESEIRKRIR